MIKLSCKHYNKWITTQDSGDVQSYDQEESKLNSAIIVNSGAHTFTDDKIIKVHSIRITQQLLKPNEILTKIILLGLFSLFLNYQS